MPETKFFWERTQRAWRMDSANKLRSKPTYYWMEAQEWLDAYKVTLSNKDLKTFEHEWLKFDAELDLAREAAEGSKPGYAAKVVAQKMKEDPEFMLNRQTLGYIK